MEEWLLVVAGSPLLRTPDGERTRSSYGAPPLAEPLNPSVNDAGLERPARLIRPGLAATR